MDQATFLVSLATVAVGAAHLALGHLNLQSLDADIEANDTADFKVFAALVIELQNDWVCLSTVNAWGAQQVFKQPGMNCFSVLCFLHLGARDHRGAVLLVMPLCVLALLCRVSLPVHCAILLLK
ncbi:MAG TPA: hypothetical protein VGE09_03310 [Pseudoxanthomonas sp.]